MMLYIRAKLGETVAKAGRAVAPRERGELYGIWNVSFGLYDRNQP